MRNGLCVAAVLISPAAQAQDYPTRLIKLMQGFPPGGNVEFVARLLAHEMSKSLGQTIIVESKPGQAGSLAAEAVANAPSPTATRSCWSAGAHPATARGLQEAQIRPGGRLRMDFDRELLSVHHLRAQGFEMCRRFVDLLAAARAKPGKRQLRHGGKRLDRAHDDGADRGKIAGVKFLSVPYRGEALAMTGLAHRRCGFRTSDRRAWRVPADQVRCGQGARA